MDRSTDASIAFSVTDNLSESVVKMKNAITSTKQDAEQLQKTLDLLTNTKMQLKNVDLKNTQAELARTKKAFEELGESATEAAREAAGRILNGQIRIMRMSARSWILSASRPGRRRRTCWTPRGPSARRTTGQRPPGVRVCCPPWEGLACWTWRGYGRSVGQLPGGVHPGAVRRAPCSPAP